MTRSTAPGSLGPHRADDDPAFADDGPAEVGTADLLTDFPDAGEPPGRPPRRGVPTWLKLAGIAVAAAAVLAVVLAYRSHQERRIIAISIARAQQLVRSDTWLGYHEAAALLAVRAAKADPLEAGSLRAFALAMLAADYRDRAAAAEASAALVEPGRAARVPFHAQLATAALALGDGQAGTALEYAGRAGEGALPEVLAARIALLAGNSTVASEAVDRALAVDPNLPVALALQGDLLRRSGRASHARAAYEAALASSAKALEAGLAGSPARAARAPHARAALGLAKLALSRDTPSEGATAPLGSLVDDGAGTPQVERARAALYLSALQARAGDRPGAAATVDKAGLTGDLRAWLERASGQLEIERGRYRVPDGVPTVLLSASDDDPYVPPPPPPPPAAAAPPKQVIHGFKVHPVVKKAKQGSRAKLAKKKASKASKNKKPTKKRPRAT